MLTVVGVLAALLVGPAQATTPDAPVLHGVRLATAAQADEQGADESDFPTAVSCGADGDCAAVGQFTPATGTTPTSNLQADVETSGTWSGAPTVFTLPPDAQTNSTSTDGSADSTSVPTGSINDVACPAAGQCLAVGAYTVKGDPTGTQAGTCLYSGPQVLTEARKGTDWADAKVAAPGDPCNRVQATEVACAGASWCTAQGFLYDPSGGLHEWMGVGDVSGLDTSTIVPTPSSATGSDASEGSIACATTASLCISTGIDASGGGSDIRPNYVLVGTNGAWGRAQSIPTPHTGDTDANFENVACSATRCYGAGSYVDGSGHTEGLLESTDGSAGWTPASLPSGVGDLEDIACGGSGCVALDVADCSGSGAAGNCLTALSDQTGTWQAVSGPGATDTGYRCPISGACVGSGATDELYSLSDGVSTELTQIAMPDDCASEEAASCTEASYPLDTCSATTCTRVQPYTDTAEDAAAAAFTITPPATSPPSSTTKPRITVACTPDPVRAGTSVTCTVTVTNPTAGGTARPAGSVRIGTGAADDPACTLGAAGTGAASCRVTFAVPTPGTATITARYAGDGTFAAGTASTTELVQADPATVSGVSTSGTTAALVATCPPGGGACRLDASMTTAAPTRHSPRVFARPAKTVTVGSAHASIAAGHRATLHVKLDRAGRRLLASHGRLKVTITVVSRSTGGGTKVVAHKTVTFRPRHRHH